MSEIRSEGNTSRVDRPLSMRDAARMTLRLYLGWAASSSSFLKTSVRRMEPSGTSDDVHLLLSASYCLICLKSEVRHACQGRKVDPPKLPYVVARRTRDKTSRP